MSFISQRAFALLLMPAALSSSSPQDIFDLLRRGDADKPGARSFWEKLAGK